MTHSADRALVDSLIGACGLDLSGLKVYTEAASGAYLLAPVLAAAAGAEKVYAETRDSRFATAAGVAEATLRAADEFGVGGRIEIVKERNRTGLRECDIVTNSGFVRPIDRDLIAALKPTAVIPLLWETWEYRPSDFDLDFCRERGVLVLGTREDRPPCDMRPFIVLFALKLLFELGFDGGKVLLLGNATLIAATMVEGLRRAGIDVTWASGDGGGDLGYRDLKGHFREQGGRYDILLLAEHEMPDLLLGPGGILDFETLAAGHPGIRVGVVCGQVDAEALRASGLRHHPAHIAPFGFLSYQPYMLGRRPVLTLFAGGLKVGEAMARARLRGLPPREAAKEALAESPAMDFPGEAAWARP